LFITFKLQIHSSNSSTNDTQYSDNIHRCKQTKFSYQCRFVFK